MARIHLLLTFDYEIFLGRNFAPPDETLFGPTARLMDLAADLRLPLTFFPDVCSVWAHRKWGLHPFADAFEAQMVEALRRGHDVQLHTHPHWLAAERADGEWRFDPSRMDLPQLGFGSDEAAAPAVIRRGVQYLGDLLRPARSDYRCLAFRAAGLALQPRDGEVIGALLEAGVVIDSSVAKHLLIRNAAPAIDYRDVPAEPNWFMSSELGLRTPAGAGLYEIPVATFRVALGARLRFLARRSTAVFQMRGTGMSHTPRQTRGANLKALLQANLRYVLGDPWFLLSADTKGFDLGMLARGFEDLVARHAGAERIRVALIGHPKLMGDRQFQLLAELVGAIRSRFGSELAFTTMRQEAASLS